MVERDPYLLDVDEHNKLKKETRGGRKYVICPRLNPSIGGKCYVCEEVSRLYDSNDQEKIRIASEKRAKQTFYLNVVFPENPSKVVIMEVGKNIGNEIIDGINDELYRDIAHPKAKKGRLCRIKKVKGDSGYPKYMLNVLPDRPDWEVPKEALDNLFNLDDIISLLEEEDIFRISSINYNDSLIFRICPPWDNGKGNKRVIAYVFRHWGVTQDEVDGKTPISGVDNEQYDTTELPWESQPGAPAQEDKQASSPQKKKPMCFGLPRFFNASDDQCRACNEYAECKETAIAASGAEG